MGKFSDLGIFINEVCERDNDLIKAVSEELTNHFNGQLEYDALSDLARRALSEFESYMACDKVYGT